MSIAYKHPTATSRQAVLQNCAQGLSARGCLHSHCPSTQAGFATPLVVGLIAAISAVTVFMLEQAIWHQRTALLSGRALQVEQSCLSLGYSLIHHFKNPQQQWDQLTELWCLNEAARLSKNCPQTFAMVQNSAQVRGIDPQRIAITTQAQADGLVCKEDIELVKRQGVVYTSKRLRIP